MDGVAEAKTPLPRDPAQAGGTPAVPETAPERAVPPPYRFTTWTFRQNLGRALWLALGQHVYRAAGPARAAVLRGFGAKVGRGCRLAGSARIEIPWNLALGDRVRLGERCVLLTLGTITIGDGCVLDYGAHLCAGTHDMNDPEFPLQRMPIEVGPGCFLGMQCYVGPGVKLGPGVKVRPRACVYRDAPGGAVLAGNPAKAVAS